MDATGSCISLLHGQIPGLGCLQEQQNDLALVANHVLVEYTRRGP